MDELFDPDSAVLLADETVCPTCNYTHFRRLMKCPHCFPMTTNEINRLSGDIR